CGWSRDRGGGRRLGPAPAATRLTHTRVRGNTRPVASSSWPGMRVARRAPMLEKQVAPFHRGVQRFRRVLMLLGAAVVCAWGIFAIAAWLTPSGRIVLVTPAVIPPPQVHV